MLHLTSTIIIVTASGNIDTEHLIVFVLLSCKLSLWACYFMLKTGKHLITIDKQIIKEMEQISSKEEDNKWFA